MVLVRRLLFKRSIRVWLNMSYSWLNLSSLQLMFSVLQLAASSKRSRVLCITIQDSCATHKKLFCLSPDCVVSCSNKNVLSMTLKASHEPCLF